jgi:hypothetical protein
MDGVTSTTSCTALSSVLVYLCKPLRTFTVRQKGCQADGGLQRGEWGLSSGPPHLAEGLRIKSLSGDFSVMRP